MTWNDLGGMIEVTGHNIPLRVSNLPAYRCLRALLMVFVQKRCLSFFYRWLIMEKGRKIDLTLGHRYRNSGIYISQIPLRIGINCLKFQGDHRSFGVATTSIQFFFLRWGHLTWPGDLTLGDLGPEFLQNVRKRCMNSCAKNGGAPRRRFPAIGEKPEWGCSNTPPARRGLSKQLLLLLRYDGCRSKRQDDNWRVCSFRPLAPAILAPGTPAVPTVWL